MAKKYTVLETWIVNETKPDESNSAESLYDRMEKQAGGKLPVIDIEQNLRSEEHFYDEARIQDFVTHLGGSQSVLDVGFGDGWPLLRLAPKFAAVTGIDGSQKRVDVTQANAEKLGYDNVTLKKGSATEMEFGDNTFDGVVASTSIEQTPDPYQALREVFRVLKPGGRFRVEFEPYDRQEKGVSEKVGLYEGEETLVYHYMLSHHRPPWERNYMVKFDATTEMKDEFRKLNDLKERLEGSPTQNPELGLQFLERNKEAIAGSEWYELEHFTSETMRETLEEIGFVNVRISFSTATLARTMWPRIKDSDLSDDQVKNVLQGLSDVALRLEAPSGLGEPLVAIKPS